jgi:predicted enzyme related to lactoylglutathione lyase
MLADSRCITTIPAADLDRARRFYTEQVGLTPPVERPDGLLFSCGQDSAFLLYASSYAGTGQGTAMSWEVTHIDAVVATLRANGIVFEQYDFPGLSTDVNGIAELPGGVRGAWFKDTEGNTVAVATPL